MVLDQEVGLGRAVGSQREVAGARLAGVRRAQQRRPGRRDRVREAVRVGPCGAIGGAVAPEGDDEGDVCHVKLAA